MNVEIFPLRLVVLGEEEGKHNSLYSRGLGGGGHAIANQSPKLKGKYIFFRINFIK